MREGGSAAGEGAAGVAEAGLVKGTGAEGMGLVGDYLLTEGVGETYDVTGTEDGAGDDSAAFGEWGDRLLDVVEVGVADEGSPVVVGEGGIEADARTGSGGRCRCRCG